MRKVHIVLSFGLSLVIEKYLKLGPRYKYLVLGLIVANELRALAMIYGLFDTTNVGSLLV